MFIIVTSGLGLASFIVLIFLLFHCFLFCA